MTSSSFDSKMLTPSLDLNVSSRCMNLHSSQVQPNLPNASRCLSSTRIHTKDQRVSPTLLLLPATQRLTCRSVRSAQWFTSSPTCMVAKLHSANWPPLPSTHPPSESSTVAARMAHCHNVLLRASLRASCAQAVSSLPYK